MIKNRPRRERSPWPPAPASPYIPLKTGAHWVVVTYDPMSSFKPLFGPQLNRRMYRASLTRSSYLRLALFLALTLESTSGPSMGPLQCCMCCVSPEWDHLWVAAAFMCSWWRVLKLRAVSPMYFLLQGLHVYS